MIATLRATQQLADRIQVAYLRRRSQWRPASPDPGVWTAAAAALLLAHQQDPRVPVDPELFVAAQPLASAIADPWGDLTQETSICHYRRRVLQIVRQLRAELRAEVRWAEGRLRRGVAIEVVLRSRRCDLSPLGRYIFALRAARIDLAEAYRTAAGDQHRSCPLYRHASLGLLPPGTYPDPDAIPCVEGFVSGGCGPSHFSLN